MNTTPATAEPVTTEPATTEPYTSLSANPSTANPRIANPGTASFTADATNALLERAFAELRAGRPVLVADSASRENEVDAILAADRAEPRWIAWTVRHSSGFLCAPMPAERADQLDLPLMVPDNQDSFRTAYTVSVDAAAGVTTGISAADRALTLRTLGHVDAVAADLIRPGHVIPLRALDGGVLVRPGHTEAAVDLVRLAGAGEVGAIAELVHDSGEVMRLPEAEQFAEAEGLVILHISVLIAWRREHDALAAHPAVAVHPANAAHPVVAACPAADVHPAVSSQPAATPQPAVTAHVGTGSVVPAPAESALVAH